MSTKWNSSALALFGFLAIAWIGTAGIGAVARTQGLTSEQALAGSAIDEASCNPRDPLSPCFQEPVRGIPVGDLLVEDF